MRLYKGGTEIPLGIAAQLPAFNLPKEAGDYRLTLDDAEARTTAEWTFRSRTVTEEAKLPGYDCLGALARRHGPVLGRRRSCSSPTT
ncbi:hypothetical protein ACFSTC_51025 [Nonomuraea ferruginea]